MTTRATDAVFDELHLLTAETIMAEIKRCRDAKEPVPPALLAQASKFLKDNGIDSPARAAKVRDVLAGDMPDFDAADMHSGAPH